MTMSNSTNSSTGSLLTDECGRRRSFHFTSEHLDTIWITRVTFPVFLFVGTFGNAFCIFTVFTEKRGPKRTFLLGLFISDLWFLWNRLIIFLGSKVWDISSGGESVDRYGIFYKITAGIWLYLESVLFFSSHWILLAFCIDRFLAISLPVHHYTKHRRYSIRALASIYVLSAVNALYIPVAYYWLLTNVNLKDGQIIPTMPSMFRQWRRIEMWWEIIIRLFGYCGTALCNFLIICRLRRILSRSRPVPPHQVNCFSQTNVILQHAAVHRTASQTSAHKIVLASSFFFFLTQSLDFIMAMLVAFSQAPVCLFYLTNRFLQIYDPFRTFLVDIYFAFGFTFYLCFGVNLWGKLRASLCLPRVSWSSRTSQNSNPSTIMDKFK